MISRTARYALRATLFIAEKGLEESVTVRELSRELDVPQNYLSKTLHRLAGAGVLLSTRGPGGGFRLSGPAEQLTLQRIIDVVDPPDEPGALCLLGRARCSEVEPCAAHGGWCHVRETIESFFGGTTIGDLLAPGDGSDSGRP